jgi:hypothetical protein
MWDYMVIGQERIEELKRQAENHRLVQEAAQQGRLERRSAYRTVRVYTGKFLIAAGQFMVARSGAAADLKPEAV